MNFLGIGPGEFFFILVLALLVIGPERLPGFARSIGRSIVRLRNWVNSSPDAQMLLQVQRELEAEINDIRTTLRQEVQSVRAEMELVRNDLEQASRTVDSTVTSATTAAAVSFPSNTIANPSTANLTPITTTDLTTPMRLNVGDVAAAQTAASQPAAPEPDVPAPVSRSQKPNWATPSPPSSSTDDAGAGTADAAPISPPGADTVSATQTPAHSTTATSDGTTKAHLAQSSAVPAAGVTTLSTADQSATPDITALQQEIRQLKLATSSISHDSFMMMKIEVEQLNRDLKKLREDMAKQKPTNSVSYDDIMMMRVQLGQLSNQIDQLHRQLTTSKSDVEPST